MLIPIVGTDETIEVPDVLENHYVPVRMYLMKDLALFKNHRRLKVFFHKGLQCSSCPNIGIYLIGAEINKEYHVDVYTSTFHMMTVDHIFPKSKGGNEALSNKQPMCAKCNTKKGSKLPTSSPH